MYEDCHQVRLHRTQVRSPYSPRLRIYCLSRLESRSDVPSAQKSQKHSALDPLAVFTVMLILRMITSQVCRECGITATCPFFIWPDQCLNAKHDLDEFSVMSLEMPHVERFRIRNTAGRWQWPSYNSSSSNENSEDEDADASSDHTAAPDYPTWVDEERSLLLPKLRPHPQHRISIETSGKMMRPTSVRRRTTQRMLTNVVPQAEREEVKGDGTTSMEAAHYSPLKSDCLTNTLLSTTSNTRGRKGSWASFQVNDNEKPQLLLDSIIDENSSCPQPSSKAALMSSTVRTTVRSFTHCCLLWILITVFLALVLIAENTWLLCHRASPFSRRALSSIWPTLPPHLLTSSVPTRYSSALHAHENGTLYISNPSPFIGPPSPQLDELWSSLLEPRYFRLSPAEISILDSESPPPRSLQDDATTEQDHKLEPLPLWPPAVTTPGVYAGIDMLHSLHCVNALRQTLSTSHDAENLTNGDETMGFMLPGETSELHLWHCIDQLRQAVLCHGDVTPVTLRPVVSGLGDGSGRVGLTMLGETERVHQCRDWEGIGAWVKSEAGERGWA